jgi:hypothetical protein
MKKSVICILGIIFIIGLATTARSFALDLVAQALPKSVFQNLPSTIKIDPNVITAAHIRYTKRLSEFKQKWKTVTDYVAEVNGLIPGLAQRAASLKQKEEECMNKPWTTAEITAANCPDSGTVECSKILYARCRRPALLALQQYEYEMLAKLEGVEGMSAAAYAACGILSTWQHEIEVELDTRAGH